MRTIYDLLAALLRYPEADYRIRAEKAYGALGAHDPEAARLIGKFAAELANPTATEIEELFIGTFELNPKCTLEFGWHIFGENYERGALMARMRRELKKHGIDERGELPDHFSLALLLLSHMSDDDAADFYAACLHAPLAKMQEAIEPTNPFLLLMKGIAGFVQRRHGSLIVEHPPVPILNVLPQEVCHE